MDKDDKAKLMERIDELCPGIRIVDKILLVVMMVDLYDKGVKDGSK